MLRAFCFIALICVLSAGTATAYDDFFYYDDDDGGRGGFRGGFRGGLGRQGSGEARPSYAAPFSPGAQNNQSRRWDNSWDDDGWDNGGWNGGGWNNGGGHFHQPQWNYQQPQYTPPPVVYSQQPIKVSMPPAEAGMCAYILSSGSQSWNYTISPGTSQQFKEDRAWKITYDRGNGHGQQTYALKPGHYRFRQSSRGWELYRSDSLADAPVGPQGPPPPM